MLRQKVNDVKIDLRLSNVNLSKPEVHKTFYRDINGLPDPVKLGIAAHYFNHDSVPLYFQLTGLGTNYTFGTVNLGLLGAGANAFKNCDEIASRPKPSVSELSNGEMIENVALILKAYTDSSYSVLKWGFSRSVSVYWVNSADPAFTVDALDNFDDGTVQGWSSRGQRCGGGLAVATNYVLSPPFSLKLECFCGYIDTEWLEMFKSFTTSAKTKQYAIIDVRVAGVSDGAYGYSWSSHVLSLATKQGADTLLYLGSTSGDLPWNKWMRIVVPLTPSVTQEIILRIVGTTAMDYWSGGIAFYMWIDDFKIISK